MSASPNNLPLEVLEKVFSYLSFDDLVKSVQFVCSRWQLASWQKKLWTTIVFKPSGNSEEVLKILELSPQLRALDVGYVNVNASLIEFIRDHCPNLEHLVISWNCIYNNTKVNITQPFIQIKKLFLSYHSEPYMNFPYLQRYFPNLEKLTIFYFHYERKDLELFLYKQHSLQSIGISCKARDGHCILPCLSHCKELKELILIGECDNMKMLSPKELDHFTNISTLEIRYRIISKSIGSKSFFSAFPNIETLKLHRVYQSTEDILYVIAKNCPRLQKLSVFGQYTWWEGKLVLQDSTLKNAFHFQNLTHLIIHGNSLITDKGIQYLQLLPELTYLEIYEFKSLTTASLKLICGFGKLQVLKIHLMCQNPPDDFSANDINRKDLRIYFYTGDVCNF